MASSASGSRPNGEIVATGESCKTRAGVKEGVEAVKHAVAGAAIIDKTGED